jgi:hypothetical protein
VQGTPRQLLFARADAQLRWVLVDIDNTPASVPGSGATT